MAVKITGTKIDIKTRTDIEELLKMQEAMEEEVEVITENPISVEEAVEDKELSEEPIIDAMQEEESVENEPDEIEPVEVQQKPVKPIVKERKPVTEYVSRFERLADTSKPQEKKEAPKKRKNVVKDEERRLSNKILKKDKDYELRPIYSEQELEEIALNEELEEANSWIEDDIDFDEYDSYYDQD